MSTELILMDRLEELTRPFPIDHVQVRPGAVSGDGTSAIALPYVDWRLYAERLDHIVGPANWSIQLIPWGPTRVIARLTILGVTKDASGEGDANDENCGTIAEAQAKKRACAEFGLGRYFYTLPKVWGKGSGSKRDFRFERGEAQRCIQEMYRKAGLLWSLDSADEPREKTHPARRLASAPLARTPDPAQLTKARQALERAEQRTGLTSAPTAPEGGTVRRPATLKQRNCIVRLLKALEGQVQVGTINRIGQEVGGFSGLSGVLKPDGLPQGLTSTQASSLIQRLQQLATAEVAA